MNKVGLIINPHARVVKKMNIDPLQFFTGISEGYADIRLTNSVAEIDPVIKEFKKLRIPYVAVCGGDGTHHHVLSRFINIYRKEPMPPILHLRAGTMNTQPRTINLKGKPEEILKRMIAILKQNGTPRVFVRDTIRVEDRYCFIFGDRDDREFPQRVLQGRGHRPEKGDEDHLESDQGRDRRRGRGHPVRPAGTAGSRSTANWSRTTTSSRSSRPRSMISGSASSRCTAPMRRRGRSTCFQWDASRAIS